MEIELCKMISGLERGTKQIVTVCPRVGLFNGAGKSQVQKKQREAALHMKSSLPGDMVSTKKSP